MGSGIPAGTTVTKVGPGATLELSNVVTLAGSGVALRASSLEVTGVTASFGAFAVGQEVSGVGIEPGTTISAVNGSGAFVLSRFPISPGEGVSLTAQRQFHEPRSIAVDNACQLHKPVLTESSHPLTCKEFDPSNGDVYVASNPNESVGGEFRQAGIDKFTPAGVFIGEITRPVPAEGSFYSLGGAGPRTDLGVESLAVDPRGDLQVLVKGYVIVVDHFSNAIVNEFRGPATRVSEGQGQHGLAVDSEHNFYTRTNLVGFQEVQEFNAGGVRLASQVGPAIGEVGFNGLGVELSTGDVYIDNLASVGRFGPFEGAPQTGVNPELERFGEGHLPGLPGGVASCTSLPQGEPCRSGGVAVSSSTGRVFVVAGRADVVQEYSLEPPAVPLVSGVGVASVTSSSATFVGGVNPRSEPVEEPTSYRFEYVTEEQFQHGGFAGATPVPAPDGLLAPVYQLRGVSAPVAGLSPGTTYRYRLLAENEESRKAGVPVVSEEHSFTTQSPGGFGLLDARSWELVSPPDKRGALLVSGPEGICGSGCGWRRCGDVCRVGADGSGGGW